MTLCPLCKFRGVNMLRFGLKHRGAQSHRATQNEATRRNRGRHVIPRHPSLNILKPIKLLVACKLALFAEIETTSAVRRNPLYTFHYLLTSALHYSYEADLFLQFCLTCRWHREPLAAKTSRANGIFCRRPATRMNRRRRCGTP